MVEETEAPRSAGTIDQPHLPTPPHRTYPLPLPLPFPLHGHISFSPQLLRRKGARLRRLFSRDPECGLLHPIPSHPIHSGFHLPRRREEKGFEAEEMAPVKLYGATLSWNVTRCVAALEEAGVEYELVPINFGTGEHKSPDHLARNPFGQVPALQDGDLYIFESRAICKYACRKNKPELLKEGDIKESAMVDVWLEVEAHQYTAALSPILFECLIHPMLGGATDQKVIDDNLVKIKNVLAVYEARLTKSKYLAGDFLSLADLNHVSVTLCLAATPYASLFDGYPHVKAWWTDLLTRPSVQKVAALMKP